MIGNRSYQKFTDAIRKDHKINDLILGLKSLFGDSRIRWEAEGIWSIS